MHEELAAFEAGDPFELPQLELDEIGLLFMARRVGDGVIVRFCGTVRHTADGLGGFPS
jgi:hypothetical protein